MAQLRRRETVSINIRAKTRQRDLIDQAAERLGRSRSEFMLEASCREAQDVLLDQAFFTVDAGTFAKFRAMLDRPLPPTDKLRRLLKTRAPWEK
ncbi:MAG: type II toxin-antitoxin system TacA family antitoxin [Candidatus Binataceae bacterium]